MRGADLFAACALIALTSYGCDSTADPLADSAARAVSARPNVILITIESLRTDHVGSYGGKSRTSPEVALTPNLDGFAKEAIVYERAHSVTSWTLSSHASLFTGLYPTAHQTRTPLAMLGKDYETLAERLKAADYQTAGVVSGPYLRAKHQLTQGIDFLEDSSANPFQPRAHSDVTNAAMEQGLIRFVERLRSAERPFYLFAYFWDPHYDFLPPAPYDKMFTSPETKRIDVHDFDTSKTIHAEISEAELNFVLSQYDGEIRATDELLGRFFGLLRAREIWDDSLIIITADHGEEFFDHGEKGHKNNLYSETVHVPLWIKYPKGQGPTPGTRDARLVSLVDVLPTAIDVTGLPGSAAGAELDGRSLLAPELPERPIFFELLSRWYVQRGDRHEAESEQFRAILRGDQKLILRQREMGKLQRELFDLSVDAAEQTNIAGEHASLVDELMRELEEQDAASRAKASNYEAGGSAELEDTERARLCALGYLTCEP